MSVREPREDDAEALAAVHERCWSVSHAGVADAGWVLDAPWSERVARWRGFCRGAGLPMWVAEVGGRPVGFVAAGPSRDDDAPSGTGEVAALYVDPDHQRAGLGAALLDRAERALAAAGHDRATLWTFAAADDALAFYAARGWRVEGARTTHAESGAEEIRLERDLAAGEDA